MNSIYLIPSYLRVHIHHNLKQSTPVVGVLTSHPRT